MPLGNPLIGLEAEMVNDRGGKGGGFLRQDSGNAPGTDDLTAEFGPEVPI